MIDVCLPTLYNPVRYCVIGTRRLGAGIRKSTQMYDSVRGHSADATRIAEKRRKLLFPDELFQSLFELIWLNFHSNVLIKTIVYDY